MWDTIRELCDDIPSISTLVSFFPKFLRAMISKYKEEYIHIPSSEYELKSILDESASKGYPGCLGFLDGVHVHWSMCPVSWRELCRGQKPYPSIGWQCAVNHKRRFIWVAPGCMGSVNDQAAVKFDEFVKRLCHDPKYVEQEYKLYDSHGNLVDAKGLWLSVDGGYLKIPQLIVGDPTSLDHAQNFFNTYMESQRKHVECAFGILKSRFRILKLPITMHKFEEVDDMFVTCCILHNMCLDVDGGDDGWHLGYNGADDKYDDGWFSDDEHHRFYSVGNLDYVIHPRVDYCTTGNLYPAYGTARDGAQFIDRRNKMAENFYYMFRNKMVKL